MATPTATQTPTPAPKARTFDTLASAAAAGAMKAAVVEDQAAAEKAANTEPCPRCGQSKFKTVTFERNGGEKVTQQVLTCPTCNDAFKAYQQEVRNANVLLIRKNPTAPEPPRPMDKFQWVIQETTPDQFRARAQATQAAYRSQYDKVVVALLQQRGYLESAPHWEGSSTNRPVMKFNEEAWDGGNGNGPGLRESLETDPTTGLMTLRWTMRNAARCLEETHAARVAQLRKELEAKLAGAATPPTDPVPDA